MTRAKDRTSFQPAARLSARAELCLAPVARHGRRGLLRTTALQAVALFGLVSTGAAVTQTAAAQPAPNARPQGGAVAGGAAVIAQTPTTTTVTQSSPRAAVNWSSFDVGANQTFVVTAPSPADVTLNRVTGPDPSQIAGHVVANDQLVIVNRNGVVFSKGAEVDTAGLVVSASGISPAQFMHGGMAFDQAPAPGAKVDNQGRITVKDRGLAALVAPQVANSGVITARMGHVVLAGAQTHTVDLYGDGMLSINVTGQVTKAALGGQSVDALVTNTGVVRADGGTVTLTAQAVDGLVTTLVSAGGKASADTVGRRAGTVLVEGEGGSVRVTGELSAQGAAAGTQGGRIEVDATQVAVVAAGARLDASGRAGGGTVAVGTTLARAQGGPSAKAPRTARGVLVAQGATLSADALDSGSGGRITVLSTEDTVFAGALTARGGAASGDGGQAEVSGGAGYALTGTADLGSAHGARGSLLLDPADLTVIATPPGDLDGNATLMSTGVLLATVTPGSTVSAAALNKIGMTTSLQLQAVDTLTVDAVINVSKGLTLQAGNDLIVNNAVSANGAISLSAGDSAITGFKSTGALTLNAPVTSLAGVTLLAGTGGISAQSVVDGTSVTMSTTGVVTLGAKSQLGVGSGAGALDITSAGVTQAAGGTIMAGTLQSAKGVTGPVDLSAGANTIGTLSGFAVGGGFKLAVTSPLAVVGTLAATGNVLVEVGSGAGGQALTFGNAVPQAGTLSAGMNGTVSVIADAITVAKGGGGLAANGAGTIEIAPFTKGTAIAVGGAAGAGTLGLPLGTLTLSDGAGGTLRLGEAAGTTTAGAIAFDQPFGATAFADLDLEATGGVSQGAGDGVAANLLTGTVLALDFRTAAASNAVAAIGPLKASAGNIDLSQAGPLAVQGAVAAPSGAVTLVVTAGSVTQASGTISASDTIAITASGTIAFGGTLAATGVTLDSTGGGVSENPAGKGETGVVQAATLTVTAGGGAADLTTFPGAGPAPLGNQVGTLEPSTATTGFGFVDSESLTVVGTSGGQTTTAVKVASTGGALTLGASLLQPGTLSAGAGGTVSVIADSLAVGLLSAGGLSAPGGGTIEIAPFTKGDAIAFGGPSGAGTLGIPFAPLLSPLTLNTEGAGTLRLGEAGGVTTAGAIQLAVATDLTGIATTLDLEGAGAATQTTGSTLKVGTLLGNVGTLTLDEKFNVIGTLGALTATDAVSLVDSGPLGVSGAVSGSSVALTVDKAGAAITLGAVTVTATGAGGATLQADSLALGAGAVTASAGPVALASFATQPMVVGGGSPTVTLPTLTTGKLILGAANGATTATTIAVDEAFSLPVAATLDLEAGGAVSQGAAVSAGTLTGTVGSLAFTTIGNGIGTLGPFTASSGGVTLTDGGALTLGGTVAGAAITLAAGGDIKQSAGTLSATTLSVAANPGAVTLNLANKVGTLEASSAAGGFSFVNAGALSVGGAVGGANVSVAVGAGDTLTLGAGGAAGSLAAASGGTVAITADGVARAVAGSAISAPSGTVQIAPSTTGDGIAVGGTASLGTIAVALGSLGFNASTLRLGVPGAAADVGNVTFAGATDLTATVGALDVEISGALSQAPLATLKIGALTGAASSVTLNEPGNAIGALGPFAAGGAVSVVDGQALTVAGAVSGSSISLSVQGATGAALTLNSATLTASGAGAVTLQTDALLLTGTGDAITAHSGSVAVAPFHMLAMTVGGGAATVQLPTLDTAKLTLGAAGAGTTATSVAIDAPLALGTGALDIETTGAASQSAAVTAGTLTGTVGSLDFAAPGNLVTTLGPLTSKLGGVTLLDARSLTVGGALSSGGDVALTAQAGAGTPGDLAVDATVGGGAVSLAAAGALSQTAAVSATTLSAAAGGGAATLTLQTNAVGTLAASSASGAFAFADGQALTVSGAVSGASVALTVASKGAALTFEPVASVTATAATAPLVSLTADAMALTAPGAVVTAAGGTVEVAPFTPGTDLGAAPGGSFQLPTIVAQTLRVGASGGVTTARDITFGGPFSVGAGTLDVEASGAVSQTAGGAITAGLLTGTVGSLDFLSTGAGNRIMSLGTVTATTGAIMLGDLLDLTISQGITATSVALKSGLTLTQTAGTIHATDAVAGSVSLTASGALTLDGVVNAPSVSLISAGGDVTEAGGVIQAGLLTGSASAGAATLATPSPAGAGNLVARLGAFSTKGTLALDDGQALTVADRVSSASGDVRLAVAGGTLSQGAGLTIAALGTVSLTASSDVAFAGTVSAGTALLVSTSGNISEAPGGGAPTGVIQAGALTGSAPSGAATLNTASSPAAGNQVAQLGAFATKGALTLADGQTLTVTDNVASATDAVTLSVNGGGLVQTAGTIKAATTAALGASGTISLSGVLNAPAVSLNSSGGDVTEAGGTILATVLTGSAPAGAATLDTPSSSATTGNQVAQLGAFATSGTLSLVDGQSLTVTGALSSAKKDVSLAVAAGTLSQGAGLTISAPGGAVSLTAAGELSFGGTLAGASVALVSQTADVTEALGAAPPTGVIQTALLTGSAASGAALLNTPSPTGSGNLVGELGAFPTKTGFTLLDGEPLTIGASVTTGGDYVLTSTSGTVTFADGVTITAGQTIDVTSSGGIVLGGTLHGAAVILTATGGDITEALGAKAPTGVIQTPLLTGSSSDGAALFDTPSPAGAGNQVASLGAFAAKGDLTLLDGEALTVSGNLSSAAGGVALTVGGGALTQNAGLTISAPVGSVALSASGDVAFGGTLAAAGVSLTSGGNITEALGMAAPAGVIQTAGTLTGSAPNGAALLNTPSPAGAGNQVANLGAFSTNGPLTLLDGETLAVVGDVMSGTDATLVVAGGLTQAAKTTLAAGGTLALTAASGIAFSGALSGTTMSLTAQGGDVDETGGSVSATLLTGSASGQALLNAAGSTNLVAQLGPFATVGNLLLEDGETLALAGAVSSKSGAVSLATSAGGITQAAGITLGAGTSISLASAAGIAFGGTLAAGQVSLVAMGGDVTETAPGAGGPTGVVQTASLTGSASGLASFDTPSAPGGGNAVAQLGPFTASGALTLIDGGPLVVAGAVGSTKGDVTLADRGAAASLTVQGAVTAEGTATLDSDGAIAVAASGAVQAGPLASLSASGALTQSGLVTAASVAEAAGGDIASSGTTTATAGAAALTADGAFTQTAGLISAAGGDVVVTAKGGSVTQGAGASILDTSPAQAVRLAASGGIAFAGTLGAAGLVSLTASGGDIIETSPGVVDAATLSGSASGSALLETASPAGSGNLVAGLAGFTTGGDFALLDGQTLAISGPVKALAGATSPGNVTVTVSGDLAVAADVAAAASLALSASGAISQTAGAISAGGSSLALDAGAGIAFGGVITTPGTVTLTAHGGDVTETGPGGTAPSGTVLAALLTGSATGQALFDTPSPAGAGNLVASLGGFTTAGALTLADGETLVVTGAAASSTGPVTLTVAGSLGVPGSVAAGAAAVLAATGDVTQSGLVSGASVTETAGGSIAQTAGTVSASAGSLTLTAQGGAVTQDAGAVVTDTASGQTVSLTASAGIAFGGLVATPGAVVLTAQGGDVTETAPGAAAPSGAVQASSLSGAASGQALLNTPSPAGAGNQVGTLSAFSAGGALTLLDGAPLAVAGDVTAGGSVALTSAAAITQTSGTILADGAALTLTAQGGAVAQSLGALIQAPAPGAAVALAASTGVSLGGTVSTPGSVSLAAAGGDAAEAGGVILAGTLAASATGQVLLATSSPAGAGNLVAQLGSVSAGGDFTLADGEALAVSGVQTAANAAVTVNGGSLAQTGGTFAAAGTLALTASAGIAFAGVLSAPAAVLAAQGGAITESASGAALFGTLSGSAAGDVSLAAPSANRIARIGALSAGGAASVADGESLTVAGPLSAAGAVTITTPDDLALTGALTGASVTETVGGAITQSGSLTATTGDASLTAGAGIRQTGGLIASATGNVSLTSGGGIAFAGTVSAARTATLTASAGDIVETAPGALVAAVLTGSASGLAALDSGSGNQVAQLGAFTTGGGFALADGAPLLVSGPLTARAGTAALTVGGAGDALTLAGRLSAPTANLVSTGGDVTEAPAGLLSVTRLTGSAGGAASFGSANQVAQLGPFTTGAGFALVDAAPLSVTDSVSAAGGPVAISVTGAGAGLTQTAGTVSAGGGAVTLTVASGGFSQSAGATLSDTDAAGGIAITAQGPISLGGLVAGAAGPVSLVSQAAGIAETGAGAIQAGSLAGSSAGATSLATTSGGGFGNQVARLGAFAAGGAFMLLDGTALSVSGPLRATTIDVQTTAALTLAGGEITATRVADGADYATLLQTFPLPAGAAYDIYLKAASVTQTGLTLIDPGAAVQPLATAPQPTLRIDLAGQTGAVQFAGLQAPGTQLFLSLNDGTASGQVDVAGLHLATSMFAEGSASFSGQIGGRFGTEAASESTIVPLRNGAYRINSCPIGSVNCILLSPILVPITNPVQDVEIGNTNNRQDDPDLVLPNVGEQDY